MADILRSSSNDYSGTVELRRAERGAFQVAFAGDWRVGAPSQPIAGVLDRLKGAGTLGTVDFVADDVTSWDTSFLLVLRKLEAAVAARGGEATAEHLPDGVRRLLALTANSEAPTGARRAETESSFLAGVGLGAQGAWRATGEFVGFIGETALSFLRLFGGKARFRGSDLALIVQDVGARALPIVSLISFLVGMILAFVGAVQLRQFGVEIYVANLVGIAMLREMGALMTAIIMAGRTGAAFAAEIGSMQANEEVDALSTLGFNPVDFLVLPRVLALIIMMPLLALYADILGILGGALIGTTMLGLDFSQYWAQSMRAISMTHLFIGLAKASVFGVIVALAGCQRGITAGRSASAVGMATTSSVVLAIVLIVVADGLFAVALDILGF
ncbi:MAG TPA: ABC transporter permease [Alphaproteobacteria bacterium]|jgi:phospholipid/cholesterol/gamma-HCH transport system permease protein